MAAVFFVAVFFVAARFVAVFFVATRFVAVFAAVFLVVARWVAVFDVDLVAAALEGVVDAALLPAVFFVAVAFVAVFFVIALRAEVLRATLLRAGAFRAADLRTVALRVLVLRPVVLRVVVLRAESVAVAATELRSSTVAWAMLRRIAAIAALAARRFGWSAEVARIWPFAPSSVKVYLPVRPFLTTNLAGTDASSADRSGLSTGEVSYTMALA